MFGILEGLPAFENSWQPEENMNYKDFIQKFMDEIEQIKQFDRSEVQLYTKNTSEHDKCFVENSAVKKNLKRNEKIENEKV